MNEKQQQLLDYISQNNLSPLAASMYVKHNADFSSEDRSAVLQHLSDQEQANFEKKREEGFEQRVSDRQKYVEETQAQVDAMTENLSQGSIRLENAKSAYENYGGSSALMMPTTLHGILFRPVQSAADTNYFTAMKEFDDLRRGSIEILKREGRVDLASAIKMPAYNSTEVMDDMFTAVVEKLAADTPGMAVDVYESARTTLGADPSQELQDLGDEYTEKSQLADQAYQFLNIAQGAPEHLTDVNFGNVLEAVQGLAIREIPHLTLSLLAGLATGGGSTLAQGAGFTAKAGMYGKRFLRMQKSAPAILNMITRGTAAYQRIANDPNLSNAQKYAHSSLMGVVEGAGDSFLAATFGLSGVGAKAATSEIGKAISRNAIARATAGFVGATSGEAVTEIAQELAAIQSERSILGKEVSGAEVLARVKEAGIGGA